MEEAIYRVGKKSLEFVIHIYNNKNTDKQWDQTKQNSFFLHFYLY